jgi:eukaryotic-like serine/threonine-protein kinase
MEYLDGLDLQQMVERYGALRPERVVHLLLQVCDSLAEAHQAMLIHRDIKPANIYVCRRGLRDDRVKVLDFGLVKPVRAARRGDVQLTTDGCISGTPAFIAPEAALGGEHLDHRADIYSLGCVAYYLLTGRMVFEADSAVGMLLAHVQTPPGKVSTWAESPIPAGLEQLVGDCLQKDPEDRPANIAQVRRRLERVSSDTSWGRQEAARWWQQYDPRPRAAVECH